MKKSSKDKVLKHLEGDVKTFKHEAKEDKKLMKSIRDAAKQGKSKKSYPKSKSGKKKIEKVMHEFKAGTLHSGSKKGPRVKNRKQAVAIALSEARRAKNKKK